ncbi:MAG: MBL fold metallo-hydrolase [Erysipelotrichaceae bacterium]|nr:MBL fold metallo-hydrolase [Erysipelotrichaceae bacterium]
MNVSVLILLLVVSSNSCRYDLIPIGIIESQNNDRYTLNKFLYRTCIETQDSLHIGDILLTSDSVRNEDNDVKYDVLFYSKEYRYLATFRLKRYFYAKLQQHPAEIREIIDKTINNINPKTEPSYDFGYGLIGYYFFRRFSKKHPCICIIAIFVNNLLFVSQFKYMLIVSDIISDHCNHDKYLRFSIKCLIIAVLNFSLFDNYSILIPLLLEIFQLIDLDISFMNHLCLIESILFCRIDLFSIVLFRFLIVFRSVLFLAALFCLVFPYTDRIFLFIASIYSYFNGFHFDIRGKISIITFILWFLIIHLFHIKKTYLKTILCIFLIVSPLNDPFFHLCFIDVGQGDASLIRYPLSKHAILIDTGSSYNYQKLQKKLFAEGLYEVEYLIITHDDEDHSGNLNNLQEDFRIINIVTEPMDFEYKDIVFHALPTGEYDNENDNSLVYLLNINGYKILFTGEFLPSLKNS